MRATPDFDFGLTESAQMIREAAGRFADEQIMPLAAEIDRNDRFPRELWEPMGALGLHGITANAIAPGITETPLFQTLTEKVVEDLKRSVPVQRIGQPEDVANAVRFFSQPASTYITGQLLYVCGGRSLSSVSV